MRAKNKMDISLVKAILILYGFLRFGAPDAWDTAAEVRLSLFLPGPEASIGLNIDPVPIYYRPLEGNLCGVYYGIVVIDPNAQAKNCVNTLEHELAHVWQSRSYGLLVAITYPFSKSLWEPEAPSYQIPAHKRVLEWSLIRLWFPVGQEFP